MKLGFLHGLRDPERLALVALAGVCLKSVWSVSHWGSADGASHTYTAFALLHYFDSACSVYRESYFLNPFPVPNLGATLLLVLSLLFSPPLVAEKLLLSAYVVLLPLSLRYAIGAFQPRGRIVACLVFPFVLGLPLVSGWYNFAAGSVVFLFALGYWLRLPQPLPQSSRRRLRWLFLALYLCHPFPLVVMWLGVACMSAWGAWLELPEDPVESGLQRARRLLALSWRRAWPTLKQAVPAAVLLTLFAVFSFVLSGGGSSERAARGFGQLAMTFLINEAMAPLSEGEVVLAALFGGFLWLSFVAKLLSPASRAARRQAYGLLILLGCLLALFFLLPDRMMGGGNLPRRLLVFLNFALLLWLGMQHYGRAYRVAIVGVALVVTGSQTALRQPMLTAIDAHHHAVRRVGSRIADNSIVMPLNLDWRVSPQPDVPPILLRNSPANLIADRCFVDLSNYEGWVRYSPLMFRPGTPLAHWGNPGAIAAVLEAPRPPDWILAWGAIDRMDAPARQEALRLLDFVDARYELVTQQQEAGFSAWLYSARASGAPASSAAGQLTHVAAEEWKARDAGQQVAQRREESEGGTGSGVHVGAE